MTLKITPNKILAAALIFFFLLSSCAVNPVTGKKEFMLISESMEIEMGKEVDQGIRLEYGIYEDPVLAQYLDQMGQKMAPLTHRPHLKYHFAVLDTPIQNAFAAPGGYIYVTRGLLAMVNSEAELATVIGHELGHVNARHSARSLSRSILFGLGLTLLNELSEDLKKISPITAIATALLFLKYSRSDEYQADSLGVEYSRKAGYSPTQMIPFFQSIQRLTEMHGGTGLPNFLSTHPLTPARIEKVKQKLEINDDQLAINRQPMLNHINAIIYGADPRQGYVENGVFYHPGMQFFFQIPAGWKFENTPQRVLLAPENSNAIVILQAVKSTDSLETHTNQYLTQMTNYEWINKGTWEVNQFPAFHAFLHIKSPEPKENEKIKKEEDKVVRITAIKKGEMIYTFFATSWLSQFPAYKENIESAVNSFQTLTDKNHLNRQPLRVHLTTVASEQTLRQFLEKNRIPPQRWDEIALINGLILDQNLTRNQTVKIIR